MHRIKTTMTTSVLIDLVSKLSSTVQSLQQNVIHFTSQVNSLQSTQCWLQEIVMCKWNSSECDNNRHDSWTFLHTQHGFCPYFRWSCRIVSTGPRIEEDEIWVCNWISSPLSRDDLSTMRHQITSGKDVNLASLLIPNYSLPDKKETTRSRTNDYRSR